MLINRAWGKHAAAIAGDPALQQAIVSVLLGCCLSATAEVVAVEHGQPPAGQRPCVDAAQMLYATTSVMLRSSLATALQCQLLAGGAEGALEHAAAIVRALPTSRPSGACGRHWSTNLASGAILLETIGKQLTTLPTADAQQAATADRGEAAQPASQAEAVAAVGWHATRLLPQLTASLAALANDPLAHTTYPDGVTTWQTDINATCHSLCWLLSQAAALSLGNGSASELACWLGAVAAGLRLAPCLAQLAVRWELQGSSCDGAAVLYSYLLCLVLSVVPRQLCQLAQAPPLLLSSSTAVEQPGEAASWEQLPAQLWGLHTGLCRFVVALTSPAAPLRLPGERLSAGELRTLQWSLSTLLLLTVNANRRMQLSSASDALDFAIYAPWQVWV